MSKYTTEVRFICEQLAVLTEQGSLTDVDYCTTTAAPLIFDSTIPFFDEAYRLPLEKKILRHFYTREIGFETMALWQLYLNNKMNEIMPYYNKLYYSETLSFNPLYDVDYWRTSNRTNDDTEKEQGTQNGTEQGEAGSTSKTTGTSSDESTGSNKSNQITANTDEQSGTGRDLYSDTPQGTIADVENGAYLSNARFTESTNHDEFNGNVQTEGSSTAESTAKTETETNSESTDSRTNSAEHEVSRKIDRAEDYAEHVAGKMGGANYSQMLLDYRSTLLNIDMQIIEELESLFMAIY